MEKLHHMSCNVPSKCFCVSTTYLHSSASHSQPCLGLGVLAPHVLVPVHDRLSGSNNFLVIGISHASVAEVPHDSIHPNVPGSICHLS